MKIHIVQKGETLWKIAEKYGVNFETLKSMNTHLSDPNMIMPGMKIKVPTKGVPVKKEAIKEKMNVKKEGPMMSPPPSQVTQEMNNFNVNVSPYPVMPQNFGTPGSIEHEDEPEVELPEPHFPEGQNVPPAPVMPTYQYQVPQGYYCPPVTGLLPGSGLPYGYPAMPAYNSAPNYQSVPAYNQAPSVPANYDPTAGMGLFPEYPSTPEHFATYPGAVHPYAGEDLDDDDDDDFDLDHFPQAVAGHQFAAPTGYVPTQVPQYPYGQSYGCGCGGAQSGGYGASPVGMSPYPGYGASPAANPYAGYGAGSAGMPPYGGNEAGMAGAPYASYGASPAANPYAGYGADSAGMPPYAGYGASPAANPYAGYGAGSAGMPGAPYASYGASPVANPYAGYGAGSAGMPPYGGNEAGMAGAPYASYGASPAAYPYAGYGAGSAGAPYAGYDASPAVNPYAGYGAGPAGMPQPYGGYGTGFDPLGSNYAPPYPSQDRQLDEYEDDED